MADTVKVEKSAIKPALKPDPKPDPKTERAAVVQTIRELAASLAAEVAETASKHDALSVEAPHHGFSRLALAALRKAEAGLVSAAQALGQHEIHAANVAKVAKETAK